MDFVAGTTLRKRLDDEGAQPPAQALALARQIAAGLAHAHEQGIVHRDVKPANIMITDEIGHGEHVRILDFGLARLRGNVGRDATQTNMVVGTPNYMAPEQTVPAATIDARTDHLRRRRRAVRDGRRRAAVRGRGHDGAARHASRGADPAARRSRARRHRAARRACRSSIDKAMAKSPADRFQTAIELAEAIDEIAEAGAIVIEPQQGRFGRGSSAATNATASARRRRCSTSTRRARRIRRARACRTIAPRRSRFWRTLIGAALLVGGASGDGGIPDPAHRDEHAGDDAAGRATMPAARAIAPTRRATPRRDRGRGHAPTIDAARVGRAGSGSATLIAARTPAVRIAGSGSGCGRRARTRRDRDGSEEGRGSRSRPRARPTTADDEAGDAPKIERRGRAARAGRATPQLATNLHDAVSLIKDGKRDHALASLRVLRKKTPKSAYIPFLLGNLYFDQPWWSVVDGPLRAGDQQERRPTRTTRRHQSQS